MAGNSLSVCILAANEEKNLPEAIESVEGIADQILVTDTGSTDATVEVARKAGADVEFWPWQEDFGAARNHQISSARCDWILFLDADERLVPDARQALLHAVENEKLDGINILRRDLVDRKNPQHYSRMKLLRLVRRDSELQFVGHCHPQLDLSGMADDEGNPRIGFDPAIEILHFGYVSELMPDKLRRADHLLQIELQKRPSGRHSTYYKIERLRTLMLLGDEQAFDALNDAAQSVAPHLSDSEPPLGHAALLLESMLQLPEHQLPAPFDSKQVRRLAEQWFPYSPPLLWVMARLDFESGQYESSISLLTKLLKMGKLQNYDMSTSFDPAIIGDEAALNLSACYIKTAKLREAKVLLQKLVKRPAVSQRAKSNLKVVRSLRKMSTGR